MPALFPNNVRIFTSKTDLVDTVLADHVNLLQDEVTAVENTLGTGLLVSSWSGSYSNPLTHTSVSSRLSNIESGLLSRAPIASPNLTGTPTAPTAGAGTNTTQIATTAFVLGQASSTAPPMNGTASAGTSNLYSRSDHVHATDSTLLSRAPIASPNLTGTPTAPTAGAGTNTTQIATTAFVLGQASSTAPPMNGTASAGTSNLYSRSDHVHATDSTRIPNSVVTAKGDLIAASASGSPTRLAVGADNAVPVADNSQTTGIRWSSTLSGLTLTSPVINYPILLSPVEPITVSATGAAGTVAFDVRSQSVMYYTGNSTGNWTLNVRGNSSTTLNSILAVGQSLSVVFMTTQGTTPYYQTALQIDGTAVTPRWQGGATPTAGNASGVDVYTITIVKTASAPTYAAFAALAQFK